MAETRVTTSKLRESANQLTQFANSFQSEYQELFNYGKELDGTWDGDANDSFNSQLSGDFPKFETMYKTIMDYVKVLNQTADIYDKGEQSAVNTVTTRNVKG